MLKTLGIDLGTNSIGWAIVEQTPANDYVLVDKGVTIFQEGVKMEKGIESSKAAERTRLRSTRRHYFRRKLRKIETLKVLSEYELCPPVSEVELHNWHVKKVYPKNDDFIAWQRTDDNENKNPYFYRYDCLNRRLNLNVTSEKYILGRALYHIAQRRGFLSNRLDRAKESKSEVKDSINQLSKEIKEAGCTYLGEYFYQCYQQRKPIRSKYTSRIEHYKAEFDAVCRFQNLPADLVLKLERAIFFQRPLKSQKGLVGKCSFEKNKSRCPSSHPRYEEFRMWCFINNIKIKGPSDTEMRSLNLSEKKTIMPLFFRKSKTDFNFEEIEKKLVGNNNYEYFRERNSKPYQFNYREETSVSGCPVTAQLMELFGEEWQTAICDQYAMKSNKTGGKTVDEIVNDVWHVLFSFTDDDNLKQFAVNKLRLDDEKASKFAKITLPNDYAALSLNAINKILPYLREGMLYSHAVFLANIGAVVPSHIWSHPDNRKSIIAEIINIVDKFSVDDTRQGKTIEYYINEFLQNNFELKPGALDKIYHPSMIDIYSDAQPDQDGVYQLASPRTSSVRNPMAMRALFRLRKLINALLKEGRIDRLTKIHIEFARGLNDANKRKAIETYQREREKKRAGYREEIMKLYKEATGREIEPTEDDVLKYELWKEQNGICLYTGNQIGISQFVGANPAYDIEHTIPRSVGGDNSLMNKTLCECRYNRDIKRTKIPSELSDHENILTRIGGWKDEYEELNKQIQKTKGSYTTKEIKDAMIQRRHKLIMERDYWLGKYKRFTMTEVPEGFSNSQGSDIGIISKYARLYLKSVFPKIYTVKGVTTAEFRKMWGLQDQYQKKERDNHIHHCIDAITIACIGRKEYDEMAKYYHDQESYEWFNNCTKPQFPKPWDTFTQDVKAIEDELLVSHYTADNLRKHTKKKLRVRGKIQYGTDGQPLYVEGDTARGSLHNDKYYGAIMRDEKLKYVIRKTIDKDFQPSDVEKIVDDVVREKVKQAIAAKGFNKAISEPIWMNEEKQIQIKKVRCYTPSVASPLHIRDQRDVSRFEYKRQYHVVNDGAYLMAIYEGTDKRGKIKRDYKIINKIDATRFFKQSKHKDFCSEIAPLSNNDGYPLKCLLKIGTMVLFIENTPEEIEDFGKLEIKKRLYKVIGMSELTVGKYKYGTITFKHHQEAKRYSDLRIEDGAFNSDEKYRAMIRMYHTQFNALVEGQDFELTALGEVKRINT